MIDLASVLDREGTTVIVGRPGHYWDVECFRPEVTTRKEFTKLLSKVLRSMDPQGWYRFTVVCDPHDPNGVTVHLSKKER